MSRKDTSIKYNWEVIVDPTKTYETPGLFYHHLFRKSDVFPLSNETVSYWPEGIVFRNIDTGEVVEFRNGLFQKHHETKEESCQSR